METEKTVVNSLGVPDPEPPTEGVSYRTGCVNADGMQQ